MEPMDFDVVEEKHQSSLSPNVSYMEVDTSPSKNSYDWQAASEGWEDYSAVHALVSSIRSAHQDSPSSSNTAAKPVKKLPKTGYGIPDDETMFSHFPEKGCKRSSASLVHRKSSKFAQTERKEPCTFKSDVKKRTCVQSCCNVMLNAVKVMALCGILLLAIAYVLNLRREKCRLSRQFDSKALKTDLETLVFGQHFGSEIIPYEMELYFKKLKKTDPSSTEDGYGISKAEKCKPLVLSFHGWTGVGKNFISKIISNSFPGSVVNHIVIPLHFPHEALEHRYGQIIQDWLVTNNTACTVNIVVIDEMDKAFSPVTEGIIAGIKSLSQPCHVAAPTIILLLSNSYATDINRLFLELVTESKNREKLPLTPFQTLFSESVNDSWNSMFNRNGLIDAYVPFLPLEREHVLQCIKRDLVSKRFSTDSEAVGKIMNELTFKTLAGLEISITGCKRVADKVDYVMLGF
ncbi:torsin-1A-like [Elysia marginata]|uniref:Torsin-1A-like n=1 Tax=Elysia marginata TaxID=1093978 RepID=A0AAV4FDK8_9GAST|nr:torsin-1A-like [Elysia marginata]